jgi:hypothetical protein
VRDGASELVDEWMAMLNRRVDECIATLDRERMAVEVVFRQTADDGAEWMYWMTIHGDGEPMATSEHQLDHDHMEYGRRCLEGEWEELTPQLLLLPAPVLAAVSAWALR